MESLRHCPRVVAGVRGCYGVKVGCVGARAEGRSTLGGEIKKIENPACYACAYRGTSENVARARGAHVCAYAKNCACV